MQLQCFDTATRIKIQPGSISRYEMHITIHSTNYDTHSSEKLGIVDFFSFASLANSLFFRVLSLQSGDLQEINCLLRIVGGPPELPTPAGFLRPELPERFFLDWTALKNVLCGLFLGVTFTVCDVQHSQFFMFLPFYFDNCTLRQCVECRRKKEVGS